MKLYEIIHHIDNIFEYAHNHEIVVDEQKLLQERLNSLDIALTQKIENILKLITNLKSDSSELDGEINRLKDKQKVIDNKIEWLKQFLVYNLPDDLKFESSTHKLRFGFADSVQIDDGIKIPDEYYKQELVYKIDKNKIKKDLKEGVVLEGIRLQTKKHCVIT